MPSAFENLCGPGKPLRAEPPDAAEFALADAGRGTRELDGTVLNVAAAIVLVDPEHGAVRQGDFSEGDARFHDPG